ncbi:hypothetical protein OAD45_05545 [Gammaproteobacteria bacterium]|nr:hypothetical protein [Gammaproteobacteria bacterium]
MLNDSQEKKLSYVQITTNKKDIDTLYSLLQERSYSISHTSIPSYEEHSNFVKKNPYRAWYFIIESKKILGSVYVSYENIIGIQLMSPTKDLYVNSLNYIIKNYQPMPGIKSIRSKYFHINIPWSDKNLIDLLTVLGLKPVELTFILE